MNASDNTLPRHERLRRWIGRHRILTATILVAALTAGAVPVTEAIMGTSISVRFGALMWVPVSERTIWLPKGMRAALTDQPPEVTAGALHWQAVSKGFEVAELPVDAGGIEVDRLLLARIDPAHFRFEVRNDARGARDLGSWMEELKPVLLVNGSYYDKTGLPSTPVVSLGKALGPVQYDGTHGAFVTSTSGTEVRDLGHGDWRRALDQANNAMVSYPLLLAADGSNRVPAESGWLANRSFVAEDGSGRIVIGTTYGSFFTLTRLATFLRESPLGLKVALNLDGGPVACQGIEINAYHRRHCGAWELQVEPDGSAKVLPPAPWAQAQLPLVLAVFPR